MLEDETIELTKHLSSEKKEISKELESAIQELIDQLRNNKEGDPGLRKNSSR